MTTKKSTLIQLKSAYVDIASGAIYASKSSLRMRDLQPNSKDKGLAQSYTDKAGESVEFTVYSVLDAVPLTAPVKTTKLKDYQHLAMAFNITEDAAKVMLKAYAKGAK